jgi:hypothetical protein
VDGSVVKFEEALRDIPEGTVQQDFWCNKMHMHNTINCPILGNDDRLIHNLNADWQGAYNDARIWVTSPGKEVINRQRWFLVAGDSAYRSVKFASRCTVLPRPLLTHQSAFTTKGVQACIQSAQILCPILP